MIKGYKMIYEINRQLDNEIIRQGLKLIDEAVLKQVNSRRRDDGGEKMVDARLFKRELLLPGDNILFHSRGFSIVSSSIRLLTESYWNHVGKYVEVDGQGFIIEALFKGVKKTPIEKYLDNPQKYTLKAVRLQEGSFRDRAEYEAGIRACQKRMFDKIGKKYDFWAIAYIGIKLIAKGVWKKGKQYAPLPSNPLNKREEFFCSESICESETFISSLYPYLYMGKTGNMCSSTTPKDVGKSIHSSFVTGKDVL